MVIASGLLALVIGAAFAVLLRSVDEVRSSERLARRSEEVLSTAGLLERLVVDMESGQRGFFLTGQESYLRPWQAAQAAFPAVSRRLEQLAAVPEQQQRARWIDQAVTSYLRDYSVPLVAAARREEAAGRSVAATARGEQRVDAIRAEFDQLVATERRLSAARQERSDAATRRAIVAAAAGLAGSVLLILLFADYLARAIVRPVHRAAVMAGRLAAGDLGTRMPETGVDEIGTLERAFNSMAGSLQESRAELAASRARVVRSADEGRRRIERDLHDGIQQRLVSLGLDLRATEAGVPAELPELRAQLARVADALGATLVDLQEISRGIHPAILSEGGLGPALKALARRSAVPVEVDVRRGARLPAAVEVAAYYVVSEALTNAAKHAGASVVSVGVEARDGHLHLSVRDDGAGGADPARGSGLVGLSDRVQALGGTITIHSPVGEGTALLVDLPVGQGDG
jgi:signal transduction histidine kinase